MGLTAPDPTGGMGGGAPTGGGGAPASAGGGQGTLILQQVQQLLAQLMQSVSDPAIQKGVGTLLQAIDPLMQAIGQSDAQAMNSGLNTPGGAVPPEGGAAAGPDLAGGTEAAGGAGGMPGLPPQGGGFGGAKKAAMANYAEKGHFSKKGSKGEALQTDKTKNRQKAKA